MRPLAETAPFADRPPLDHVGPAGPDPLPAYLDHATRPWGGMPVPLADPVRVTLWSVGVTNICFGGWLALVVSGTAPCSGPVCTLVTWGHPLLLLVTAGVCVALLAGASVVTRGLSEAGVLPLCVLLAGVGSGVAAMSGLIALLLLLLLASALLLMVVAAVVDRL